MKSDIARVADALEKIAASVTERIEAAEKTAGAVGPRPLSGKPVQAHYAPVLDQAVFESIRVHARENGIELDRAVAAILTTAMGFSGGGA